MRNQFHKDATICISQKRALNAVKRGISGDVAQLAPSAVAHLLPDNKPKCGQVSSLQHMCMYIFIYREKRLSYSPSPHVLRTQCPKTKRNAENRRKTSKLRTENGFGKTCFAQYGVKRCLPIVHLCCGFIVCFGRGVQEREGQPICMYVCVYIYICWRVSFGTTFLAFKSQFQYHLKS